MQSSTYNFSDTNALIFLKNGFTLSVIAVTSDSIIIRIENENDIFIRVVSSNYPFELLTRNGNCCYFLRIILNFN